MMKSKLQTGHPLRGLAGVVLASLPLLAAPRAWSQSSDPNAVRWVQAAVNTQLAADENDHSAWMYFEHNVKPGNDVLERVIETHEGNEHRVLERGGKPLTEQEQDAEMERIRQNIADTAGRDRDRRAAAQDSAKETALLKMWPTAFYWSVVSETPEFITVAFRPDPAFSAPNIEARVMGQMTGQMVVTRRGSRLYSLRGHLTQDIRIAFGLVKLKAGGTFDVERREIAPGHWQIVEQHTNIQGHALLFKNIGEVEDDTKWDFKPSPASTLAEAGHQLLSAQGSSLPH